MIYGQCKSHVQAASSHGATPWEFCPLYPPKQPIYWLQTETSSSVSSEGKKTRVVTTFSLNESMACAALRASKQSKIIP